MHYNFDFNGPLLPRRISYPLPDDLGIEAGIVNTAKAGLYMSILKQVEIYKRMDDEGLAEWPVSMFGTPVFADVTLKSTSDALLSIKLDSVLLMVEQNKKIGRTHVTGRSGSVKEYYSLDDYTIEISGSIQDENASRYPMDQVTTLLNICELPEAIEVSGPFFDLFKIYNAVIHNYKLDQKSGYQNQQFFLIKMYSDLPVELEKVS